MVSDRIDSPIKWITETNLHLLNHIRHLLILDMQAAESVIFLYHNSKIFLQIIG